MVESVLDWNRHLIPFVGLIVESVIQWNAQ